MDVEHFIRKCLDDRVRYLPHIARQRMFHTPLYGLRADCRQSAGRARWPAHPGYRQNRPQKAPHGDRQDSKAFLSQPSFLSRLGRLVTFRRGGFALARISNCHRQHRNRLLENSRGDGKNCEICGLALRALRRFQWCVCDSGRSALYLTGRVRSD